MSHGAFYESASFAVSAACSGIENAVAARIKDKYVRFIINTLDPYLEEVSNEAFEFTTYNGIFTVVTFPDSSVALATKK